LASLAKSAVQTTASRADVEKFYREQLVAGGYSVSDADSSATKKSFAITKGGGTPQYITLFLVAGKGTVIVPSNQPLPNDLSNVATASQEEMAFDGAMGAMSFSTKGDPNSDMEYTINPAEKDKFYGNGNKLQGIGTIKLIDNQNATQVLNTLSQAFQSQGLETSTSATYGGGPVLVVKKGTTFVRYLNLIPATNGGVFVVSWDSMPS
jgi:hypothetical protein